MATTGEETDTGRKEGGILSARSFPSVATKKKTDEKKVRENRRPWVTGVRVELPVSPPHLPPLFILSFSPP